MNMSTALALRPSWSVELRDEVLLRLEDRVELLELLLLLLLLELLDELVSISSRCSSQVCG